MNNKALFDQASPKHNSVFIFKQLSWCPIVHLAELCFTQEENCNITPGLKVACDPVLLP